MQPLGEATYGETDIALGLNDRMGNINPADYENMLVRFRLYPHQNRKRSTEAGRPIFEDIAYVDIRSPGDRTSHIFRPASDIDRMKWPKHWDAFISRTEQGSEGTPLDEWPMITRSLVEELRFFHVSTVEQLADLSATASQQFMGIQAWVDKARAYLAATEDTKAAEALQSELTKRDNMIENLTARIEAMEAEKSEPDVE